MPSSKAAYSKSLIVIQHFCPLPSCSDSSACSKGLTDIFQSSDQDPKYLIFVDFTISSECHDEQEMHDIPPTPDRVYYDSTH